MSDQDWEPDFETAWLEHTQIGFGQDMFLLYVRSATTPVGLVWGTLFSCQDKSAGFDILGCFVPVWARRKGILSFMLDKIRETYSSRLITQTGSEDGGLAFLRHYGFLQSEECGLWYYPKQVK